jgi:hypothetical protein
VRCSREIASPLRYWRYSGGGTALNASGYRHLIKVVPPPRRAVC